MFTLVVSDDQLNSLAPNKLADLAFNVVHDYMKAHTRFEEDVMLSLPQPWRAVWLTRQCKADVDNGGFHQFFWNSEGHMNDAFLEDLRFLGAMAYEQVVSKAVATFSEYDYVEEKRRAGFSWHKFTAAYRQKRLERFDDEFYELEPDLRSIIGVYVKAHIEKFK